MIAGRLRYILEHNRRRACRHKHGERMKKNEKNTTDAGKSNRMPLTFTNYKLMLIGFAVIFAAVLISQTKLSFLSPFRKKEETAGE